MCDLRLSVRHDRHRGMDVAPANQSAHGVGDDVDVPGVAVPLGVLDVAGQFLRVLGDRVGGIEVADFLAGVHPPNSGFSPTGKAFQS